MHRVLIVNMYRLKSADCMGYSVRKRAVVVVIVLDSAPKEGVFCLATLSLWVPLPE